jgi:rare lipoprotein A
MPMFKDISSPITFIARFKMSTFAVAGLLWSTSMASAQVELSKYADATGYIDVQKLTCELLLAVFDENYVNRLNGAASTYNPYLDENGSQEKQTASGEPYDPSAWTAAIRIDLREQFGGVRYGKNYRPAFVLVELGEKCVIVKINDVGPLGPGRVIDLNEQSMLYFDATQQLGLISDVKVTLLPGEDWTPGPVRSQRQISLTIAQ